MKLKTFMWVLITVEKKPPLADIITHFEEISQLSHGK